MWRIFYTCLQNITEKVKTNHFVDPKVLVENFPFGCRSELKKKNSGKRGKKVNGIHKLDYLRPDTSMA